MDRFVIHGPFLVRSRGEDDDCLALSLERSAWVDFPEVRNYLVLDNLIRLAEHPHLADSEIQRLSGLSCGEFSAMIVVIAEKEKQTFLRSKNVYGELDAMPKAW